MRAAKLVAKTETAPVYAVVPVDNEDAIIARALAIVRSRMRSGPLFNAPAVVKDYLVLRYAGRMREEFDVLLLDSQHRLIEAETVGLGTLTQCSVYPREIARLALAHHAAAVILAHNHPSGLPEPSTADRTLTTTIRDSLQLLDVRVLDHLVVGGADVVSFAERGLI